MRKTARHSYLLLAVFSFGVVFVSLPRIATSTRTKPEPATTSVRQIALMTKDLVYDPATQRIYASVPSSAGGIGNSITQIDPVAGTVGASVPIGSEPGKLAISDNPVNIAIASDHKPSAGSTHSRPDCMSFDSISEQMR